MKIATKQKIEVKVDIKKETLQTTKNVVINQNSTACKSCGNKKN
jgi:hypothetical protein